VFGARPLKPAIQERIENPLAKRILEGGFAARDVIVVDASGNQLTVNKPN
jgi:ATP-dependent Clp protease ATP-binding subunit ClpB